mmetsp:Transcript_15799/g.37973  ORF Transcript_15799/g.37973 Transcript_15799/m.37973 type:complete len:328 (-) Transcript_15799:913-1896(-)
MLMSSISLRARWRKGESFVRYFSEDDDLPVWDFSASMELPTLCAPVWISRIICRKSSRSSLIASRTVGMSVRNSTMSNWLVIAVFTMRSITIVFPSDPRFFAVLISESRVIPLAWGLPDDSFIRFPMANNRRRIPASFVLSTTSAQAFANRSSEDKSDRANSSNCKVKMNAANFCENRGIFITDMKKSSALPKPSVCPLYRSRLCNSSGFGRRSCMFCNFSTLRCSPSSETTASHNLSKFGNARNCASEMQMLLALLASMKLVGFLVLVSFLATAIFFGPPAPLSLIGDALNKDSNFSISESFILSSSSLFDAHNEFCNLSSATVVQ